MATSYVNERITFFSFFFCLLTLLRYSHGVSSPGRHVRTRLYFTSESHLHSLLTVLRFGGLVEVLSLEQIITVIFYFICISFIVI